MADLSDVLDELDRALDRAHGVPLLCQRPEDVANWVCRLQAVRSRMDALCCAGLVAAGSLDVAGVSAKRNVAAVVAAATNAEPKSVVADVGLGGWIDRFGVFAEAFAAGVLTRRHVQALRRVENVRTATSLHAAQDYLVEAAAGCDWREFVQVLRYWELAFDPDGVEPVAQIESRFCRVSKRADGVVDGRFRLDPIAGQAVLSALEQEEQRLFRRDSNVETPTGPTSRTPTQRRADALTNITTRGATRTESSTPAPLVHLVFGADVLDTIGTGTGDSGVSTLDPELPQARCELIDGTPIHPSAGLATMAAATVRRIVLGAPSELLDLGRAVRAFPPRLKQALLVTARGRCTSAGCDAPVAWLQADHIHPWHHEGRTATSNGQILCDPHNKAKGDRPQAGGSRNQPKLE